MPDLAQNPAKKAAEEARVKIQQCIAGNRHFLVEAGAGAGKTYSLVEALNYLIAKRGADLLRHNQRVACITYTNVATDEINVRTDRHPAIQTSTIHAFCWSIARDFQPLLRSEVPNLAGWPERLLETNGVGARTIDYNLGHPKIEDDRVLLHHNDVLTLTIRLLELPKFRHILAERYPVIFIDEYQDTDRNFAEALKIHFLNDNNGPLVGFFGDHWQKIYGNGCGKIEHPNLKVVGKNCNFRSVPRIVGCLNNMRPELPQEPEDPGAKGTVTIYHTNSWSGMRRTGQHWGGDVPAEVGHAYLNHLRSVLAAEGWDFSPVHTKILMLTHKVLAAEQGYAGIESLFPYNDAFIKKEDPCIAFFCDVVEPVCAAYACKRFGEMFELLGTRTPRIMSIADKKSWAEDMEKLLAIRATGTIGEVLDCLKKTKRPRLPEAVENREHELAIFRADQSAEEPESIVHQRQFRALPYQEVIALDKFIDESTPFATKHGVKGAEFENVLVIFGRGWNQYNFNQFLEWAGSPHNIPSDRLDAYERNRNLFYVVCSRPRKRLAVLFTQSISPAAITTLSRWFGSEAIHALTLPR
jgi:DNA helicase-2/ATP-dependent DNA helicase PcrA